MSDTRRGEKIGWMAGWAGGFAWVLALALAVAFAFRGMWAQAGSGLVLSGAAAAAIAACAPWRHPDTTYGRLMLLPYALLFLAVGWAIWAFGGTLTTGFDWWQALWFVPLLFPLGTLRKRTWRRDH